MAESSANLETRISFRTNQEIKDLIERADMSSGLTVTDYALTVLVNHSQKTVDENCVRTLSPKDTEFFLGLLEKEARPNSALTQAAKRYKKRVRAR